MKLSEFRKKIEETIVGILNEVEEDPIKAVKDAEINLRTATDSLRANSNSDSAKKTLEAAKKTLEAAKSRKEAADAKKKENPTGTQPNQKP
jgi:HSP90 family molecular chaperone